MKITFTVLAISITLSGFTSNNIELDKKVSAFIEKPNNNLSLLTNHSKRRRGTTSDACIGSKTFLIDAYYGLFSPYSMGLKKIYDTASVTAYTKGGIGTAGTRATYMFTDKIEVGLEANFTRTTQNWTRGNYLYTLYGNNINTMLRMNYHLIVTKKFDGYIGGGGGTYSSRHRIESPDYTLSFEDTHKEARGFTFRLGLGGRYFITERNAISFEIGSLGGAYIHIGIMARFARFD